MTGSYITSTGVHEICFLVNKFTQLDAGLWPSISYTALPFP